MCMIMTMHAQVKRPLRAGRRLWLEKLTGQFRRDCVEKLWRNIGRLSIEANYVAER